MGKSAAARELAERVQGYQKRAADSVRDGKTCLLKAARDLACPATNPDVEPHGSFVYEPLGTSP